MDGKSLRPKTDKDFGAPPPGYVAGRGRGAVGFASGVSRDRPTRIDEEKDTDLGDGNYDSFVGYKGALFKQSALDKEDAEADAIYDMVESRMESRRKKRGPQDKPPDLVKNASQLTQLNGSLPKPTVEQDLAKFKSNLSHMSESDWLSIPDAQERLKAKRVKKDSELAASDQLIVDAVVSKQTSSLTDVGDAKKALLEMNLANSTGSAAVSTSLDPESYLKEGSAQETGDNITSSTAEIGEIKKARLLFKSITKSDPLNATGWLASARLEEVAGNLLESKGILARGIINCPSSEELWLNAVRLETDVAKAKSIVGNGIRKNPKSVMLWTKAAELEESAENKKKVLQKALEFVPNSLDLWKLIINIVSSEKDDSNKKSTLQLLLSTAVQKCPLEEELWLAHAKLSDFVGAQKILNEARRNIPTSVNIWIAAAELAESMGTPETAVESIVKKARESLGKNGVLLDKRSWLDIAVKSNELRHMVTVPRMIIKMAVTQFVAEALKFRTPKEVKREILVDVDILNSTSAFVCEWILKAAVFHTSLSERKGLWIKLLERMGKTTPPGSNNAHSPYEEAVVACPHSELLWLMYARHAFLVLKNFSLAKSVLEKAVSHIPDSENVWLAAIKVEWAASGDRCRDLLLEGISNCPDSVRLHLKLAVFERCSKNYNKCIESIEKAIVSVNAKSSGYFKFFLIAVQVALMRDISVAREWATRGCDACPNVPAVWIMAADVAVADQDYSRARSILERGRIRLPNEELLWWKGNLAEELSSGGVSSHPACKMFLSRALQACPSSGLLWSLAIDREPVATRHPKCLDGLKNCENDPLVILAVARFFWIEKRQIEKARKWFHSALGFGERYGQVWCDFFAFEVSQGSENAFRVNELVEKMKLVDEAACNAGIEWNAFRKNREMERGLLFLVSGDLLKIILEFAKFRFPAVFEAIATTGSLPLVNELVN